MAFQLRIGPFTLFFECLWFVMNIEKIAIAAGTVAIGKPEQFMLGMANVLNLLPRARWG